MRLLDELLLYIRFGRELITPLPTLSPDLRSPPLDPSRVYIAFAKVYKYPGRASKSAGVLDPSIFFLGPLVKKPNKTLNEESPDKIRQTLILRFLFLEFYYLAPPATAGHRAAAEITKFRNGRGFWQHLSGDTEAIKSTDTNFPNYRRDDRGFW